MSGVCCYTVLLLLVNNIYIFSGGCCRICSSVEHYKKDCPELQKQQGKWDINILLLCLVKIWVLAVDNQDIETYTSTEGIY